MFEKNQYKLKQLNVSSKKKLKKISNKKTTKSLYQSTKNK